MTGEEKEHYEKSWRINITNYKSVEGLLEDELAVTNDTNWIENLTNKLSLLNFN